MATLVDEKNGFRMVVTIDGRRRTRRLGQIKRSDANAFVNLVEDLVRDRLVGRPHDAATIAQVDRLSQRARDQLATLGLIRGIEVGVKLENVLQRYVEQIKGKAATKQTYLKVQRNLNAYFPGRLFASIGEKEAHRFRAYLEDQDLAQATIARRIISCRTIWHWAVKQGLASANPFVEVRAGQQTNAKRKVYVEAVTVETLMERATPEMRLALCLSRYAGLRVPSELLTLRWQDIDFSSNRMTVHSPKTEHHVGGESRVVPLFPQIRKHLEPMRRKTGYVFVEDRREEGWWKSLKDLCKRCKIKPWEKLWHNLRASCQTDLSRNIPSHVVCNWLGNSLRVAEQHYLQITEADLQRAHSCAHFGADIGGQTRTEETQNKIKIPENVANRDEVKTIQWAVQGSNL